MLARPCRFQPNHKQRAFQVMLHSHVLRTRLVPSSACATVFLSHTGLPITLRAGYAGLHGQEFAQVTERTNAILNAKKIGGKLGVNGKARGSEFLASKGPSATAELLSQPQSTALHQSKSHPRLQGQHGRKNLSKRGQAPVLASSSNRRGATPRYQLGRAAPKAKSSEKEASILQDEAYFRRTMSIPTKSDYPEADLDWQSPKSLFHNASHTVSLRTKAKQLAKSAWECTLYFKSPQRDEVVIGQGRGPKVAEKAAYLHLLARLHQEEVLLEALCKDSASQETVKENKDAIIDIYNYAAKFDMVPTIERSLAIKRTSGRKRALRQVSIRLSEQEIHVTGHGVDPKSAEVDAALRFKAEAERYQARQGNSSLIIKDSTALTVESAESFLEFLRIVRPGIKIDIDQGQQKVPPGQIFFSSQLRINGELIGTPVVASTKSSAVDLARLIACVSLKREDSMLWPKYLRAMELGNGQILRPVSPLDMVVSQDCSLIMRETLLAARRAGLPDSVDQFTVDDGAATSVRDRSAIRTLTQTEMDRASETLQKRHNDYLARSDLASLRQKKAELPMNQYRAKVLDLVNNNMYSIIVGATGSGKTTQVPQILLEEAIAGGQGGRCNVICTQPRRIAAVSVARRVADERAEDLRQSVGYHVRFDPKLPQLGGSIQYCTTGIFLQKLQHMPDELLDNTSHLIVDEVHERDMMVDFLLILLKKNVSRRQALGKRVPKVVLMSATLDTDLFASYFKIEIPGKESVPCPSLVVPGRSFPVRERYLDEILQDMNAHKTPLTAMQMDPKTKDFLTNEHQFRIKNPSQHSDASAVDSRNDEVDRSVIDWKQKRTINADGTSMIAIDEKETALIPYGLIACTVSHILRTTSEGAILVFLPGLEEIIKVSELLDQASTLGCDLKDRSRFKLYQLHSSIPDSQSAVFESVPEGCRKIILSTNIAETSVTIPDVQYVIDTGKLRERQYDQERRITMLVCNWISKSNSKQRAGRAGRVQNGNYYALFSKERYDSMRPIGLPELLRSDLQEICLDVKSQAFDIPVREFLAEAIEPPAPRAVDTSVLSLQALNALTDKEDITPLGRLLAALPVHPSLGKMIVLGIIFRCLDPMLILGAASAERQLFLSPLNARIQARQSKRSFDAGTSSDHIALLNAVREIRRIRATQGEYATRDYCMRNFLHVNAFKSIDATAKQIEEILVQSGLIPHTAPHYRARNEYGHPPLNENSQKIPLIKALALSGSHPNLAVATGARTLRTPGEKTTLIHPSSTNAGESFKDPSYRLAYGALFSYSQMAKTNDGNSLLLRDTTESTPLMSLLFGGKLRREPSRPNVIEVDNWLPFYVISPDRRTPQTLLEFRKALERLLTGAFRDMGQMARQKADKSQLSYLADDRVRELFAGGLVEVLDKDVKPKENVRKKNSEFRPKQAILRR